MPSKEYVLHRDLCQWVEVCYPDAYYRSDLAGQMRPNNSVKYLQKYRGHPDFAIFERNGNYPALFLELKAGQEDVYLKRGGLPSGKAVHLIEQAAMVMMLRLKGFAADLVIGRDQAEKIITWYLTRGFDPPYYTGNISKILDQATDHQIRLACASHPIVQEFVGGNNG